MSDGIARLLDKAERNYEIAEIAKEKGYNDVTVSRYYYALFQNMNFVILHNNKDFKPPEREDSHINTQMEFEKIVNKNYSKLLRDKPGKYMPTFTNLKRLRRKADYTQKFITPEELKDFSVQYAPFYEFIQKIIKSIGDV